MHDPRVTAGFRGNTDSTEDSTSALPEAVREAVRRALRSPMYASKLRGFEPESRSDFRKLPLTTRADLESAGVSGTRAAPIEAICHYGETSGTSGRANSTWLTHDDLARNARAIATRHPDVFAPGKILLNRFPFMAAPAHLIQLIAQQGGGVAIPAGNINWDVPFPRALELARKTGAQVLAGLPLEPILLAELAKASGIDPARDFAIDTFFLGGAALPPVLQRRIEQVWGARVIELYGSTETMLLGTACGDRTLHLETDLAYCEFLRLDSDEPALVGEEARFVVTTLAIEGSPLVRFETGDIVRRLPPCRCGDPRTSLIVLGRQGDVAQISGQRLYAYALIEAAAAAADALDSSIFFTVVMPDRLIVRVETAEPESPGMAAAYEALRTHLPDVPVEIECVRPNSLLDVEQLSRSPSVYKPVLVSDWTRDGRKLISVSSGMMEWETPSLAFIRGWLYRGLQSARRRRGLRRELKAATRPRR